ncbi:hypothetical protein [Synechococcus sp. PCC 7335]|uniref:hypothetical protein n=1 Tax=Synechococcus sp. (strain ATCC 29403 / PCC 7335) TaxID=91464 RepID=UPI00056F52C5|nr:hypothetical protein [Synechococcus sp. PCC 7335]
MNELLYYYEKLARKKVLKRTLLGRVLLGIEGTKQRNWEALYLVALPVDAVIVVGKRIFWPLSVGRPFIFAFAFLIALVFVIEHWPEMNWLRSLSPFALVFVTGTVTMELIRIYRGDFQ